MTELLLLQKFYLFTFQYLINGGVCVCALPGHCIVLQGSCSSLSPVQAGSLCVSLVCVSVWLEYNRAWSNAACERLPCVLLQSRNLRLRPTSSTWLKQVLLHWDQAVHLLHFPSGKAAEQEERVICLKLCVKRPHFSL